MNGAHSVNGLDLRRHALALWTIVCLLMHLQNQSRTQLVCLAAPIDERVWSKAHGWMHSGSQDSVIAHRSGQVSTQYVVVGTRRDGGSATIFQARTVRPLMTMMPMA